MTSIEIDFDLFKELTFLRRDEADSLSDVIRRLLAASETARSSVQQIGAGNDVPPPEQRKPSISVYRARIGSRTARSGWIVKGISFPSGTQFRAIYKGKTYTGIVRDNALEIDGKLLDSPSDAAKHVTGTNVNGWRFWECKRPGENWTPIDRLRT